MLMVQVNWLSDAVHVHCEQHIRENFKSRFPREKSEGDRLATVSYSFLLISL